ncbi:MAG TPA: bifunctional diaminohydroxyphosphoribosylaminopyrimidine deaminase/5-amino-6-(5-phosphoribosylamino)uracil reductase RibD [Opitutaceae bacterium]|jgi:diaminohydroxyphosphoribosylaminopyrimidine deaminase/5-amino-6-(5-phosphoribosylamino)uracil reductase
MSPSIDEHFMRHALQLARRAWGRTHPNPMVGAVIVEGGQVVAEGYHARDGGPHAERVALAALGRDPKPDATLYVTLEPCSTAGRTGACTEAILATGISRVVVGATDPLPAHAGHGFQILRERGVTVETGVLEAECADLNLLFNHWAVKQSPLLAAKVAVTLDGRMACRTGDSRWITGEAARADVHRWRRLFPGIAVGAQTVLKDNPRLTARVDGEEFAPWRFVFDGLLRTVAEPTWPQLFKDEFRERTIVVTTSHAGDGYVRKLRQAGVQVWVFVSPAQRVNFSEFRARCAEHDINGVYFEGGPTLVSLLMQEQQLDYLFSYTAPLLLADEKAKGMLMGLRTEKLTSALRLGDVRHERFGDDSLCRGQIVYPSKLQIDETAKLG